MISLPIVWGHKEKKAVCKLGWGSGETPTHVGSVVILILGFPAFISVRKKKNVSWLSHPIYGYFVKAAGTNWDSEHLRYKQLVSRR